MMPRCVTCAKQVYVMPDPGLDGAAIGGDAIAEACIRKPSSSVKVTSNSAFATLSGKSRHHPEVRIRR
jgi:hypothetical protein